MLNLFKVFTPPDLTGEELLDVLKSGRLTSGEKVRQLEAVIGEYIGNPLFLLTANNNFASIIALGLLDLHEGDEIIASPMACLASNQPILNFRATPAWADIDPTTGTLDPADVRRRITKRTKAILHYHWCGFPGHIAEINAIGAQHGIPVIDDAIEAFGAEYRGRRMGGVGTDVTTFSFQTVRLPNCVDGGGIAFKSAELYERAQRMRDFGIERKTFRDDLGEISKSSDIRDIGYNAIMNEMNASIGLRVMQHVPALLERQRCNAEFWNARLPAGAQPIHRHDETQPNYWVYSYRSANMPAEVRAWRDQGVYASKVHLRNDLYSCFGAAPYALPGVDDFAASQLSLPSGWWMTKEWTPPPGIAPW